MVDSKIKASRRILDFMESASMKSRKTIYLYRRYAYFFNKTIRARIFIEDNLMCKNCIEVNFDTFHEPDIIEGEIPIKWDRFSQVCPVKIDLDMSQLKENLQKIKNLGENIEFTIVDKGIIVSSEDCDLISFSPRCIMKYAPNIKFRVASRILMAFISTSSAGILRICLRDRPEELSLIEIFPRGSGLEVVINKWKGRSRKRKTDS